MKIRVALSALGLCFVITGCHSIGPSTVARDRFDYSDSLGESWKRQTLLNIVKLRYLDPPIFVDVGQIVSGYTLQTGLSAGASLPQNGNFGGNTATFGGSAQFTDRPTVTYTPLTGNKFLKSLMTPLEPQSVFFAIQSGWPADAVLFASVGSINGLKNQETSLDGVKPADPDFLRAIALFRKIQDSGAVGMRIILNEQKQETALVTFRSKEVAPEIATASRELRDLLHLDPDTAEFKLVFGAVPANNQELAVITWPVIHLMQIMASQIEVPAKDLAETRATPGWENVVDKRGTTRIIQIHSSENKPSDAFVSINYRNHWFWIDDRDLKSKRVFGFMMLLFTLSDPGEKEPPPLITIPAQ